MAKVWPSPNPRLERTRSASPPSPLSRQPLGGRKMYGGAGTVTAIFVVVLSLVSCSGERTANSLPKKVTITAEGGVIEIEGRWVATTPLDGPMMAKLNSTTIVCVKAEMKCRESLALLFTRADESHRDHEFLTSLASTLDVVSWSASEIRAVEHAPAGDLSIRIAIPDGPVTRAFQESRARGNMTADPSVKSSWELR